MKKFIVAVFLLFLVGCGSAMEKQARSETFTEPEQVIEAIKKAKLDDFKNYLFLDLRENPSMYIEGFQTVDIKDVEKLIEGKKTYTFMMVLSDSTELTSERVSYIQSQGFINVKYINIPVETLLDALEKAGFLYQDTCPVDGC